MVDNRLDLSNIIESGLSFDEQLQLARSAKEQLLKQKELKSIRADIEDLCKGVEPKSVRGRLKQRRPYSDSGDVNQRRDRSSSKGKDDYFIKPDSLDFYYEKNCKEHQEWTQLAQTAFLIKSKAFCRDKQKIVYAMQKLRGNSMTNWFNHWEKGTKDTNPTWEYFTQYLLNLIKDPENQKIFTVQ